MKIKSETRYLSYLAVGIVLATTLFGPKDLSFRLPMVSLLIFCIVYCVFPQLRVLIVDSDGCTVQWFFLKKRYRWDDFVIITHDVVIRPKARYEGIFFSSKTQKKDFPSKIFQSFDFLNCFWILLDDNNEKEKEKMLHQLEEWGVKYTKGKTLEEEERYDKLVKARKKVREERKQLYEEQKRRNKKKRD